MLSIIAAALLLVVFVVSSRQDHSIDSSDKLLPAAAFIASCLLCISFAVRPNWATKLVSRSSPDRDGRSSNANARRLRGHHPDCVRFKSHRISWGGREFCSGCVGLMSGATVSILLMIIYVISDWAVPAVLSRAFIALGLGAVSIAFAEAAIGRRRPLPHLIVNSTMIVGFFMLVAAMLEATGSGVFGLLVVSFSFLWIDTRIQLSHWRHSIVCDGCPESCKMD
jgi:hypothetical protein